MKKSLFTLMLIVLMSGLTACSQDSDVIAPQSEDQVTIGQVHTELLQAIYVNMDPVTDKSLDKTTRDQAVVSAVYQISDKYGLERMSPEEIMSHVQTGRDMARRDPVELISELLSPEERQWWDRFSYEAEISDARKVYREHVRLYGAPEPGSMLAQILDVGLSSAEFWYQHRADDEQTYHNPYVPAPRAKSWKKFIRFAVQVVVDGAAGGAAGVGAGTVSGPVGGAVVGGIVGGLASHGADDVLFG